MLDQIYYKYAVKAQDTIIDIKQDNPKKHFNEG